MHVSQSKSEFLEYAIIINTPTTTTTSPYAKPKNCLLIYIKYWLTAKAQSQKKPVGALALPTGKFLRVYTKWAQNQVKT